MFSKDTREINLSESVVAAMEALKMAIEVFFGYEVRFTGAMKISPGKIRKYPARNKEDIGVLARDIQMEVSFRERDREVIKGFYPQESVCHVLSAELSKYDKERERWYATRLHFDIVDPHDKRTWFWAHFDGTTRIHPHVQVGVESSEDPTMKDKMWREGRCITGRKLVPMR